MRDGLHTDKIWSEDIPDGNWIDAVGDEVWVKDGKYHRTSGPAVIWPNGRKEWYLNGQLHRTDGPAVVWPDDSKAWWLYDRRYSFADWLEVNTEITEEHKLMLKLEYS